MAPRKAEDETQKRIRAWLDEHPEIDPQTLVSALLTYGTERAGALAREVKPLPRLTPPQQPTRYRLRIDIARAKPPIWRRLEVPSGIRLDVLHEVIQAAFGWTNSHLHKFNLVEGLRPSGYEELVTPFDLDEGEEGVLESTVRLDELLGEGRDVLWYEYDFSDSWDHKIRLEKAIASDDDGCRVLGGSRAAPPEDAGGIGFYAEMLDALAHPDTHEPHVLEAARHYGLTLDSAEAFDLDDADRAVSRAVRSFAAHERVMADRSFLSPSLSAMFDELGEEAQRYLSGLVADAELTASVDVTSEDAARATSVIRTMLDAIGDDGITLTAARRLPPMIVQALMSELDRDHYWIGKANREDQTYPIAVLRDAVTSLGLARVRSGRLVLTKAGASGRAVPVALYHHIAGRLPVEKREFGAVAATAMLLVIAAGDAKARGELEERVDLITRMLGWQLVEPTSRFAPSVLWEVSGTRRVLEWAGSGILFGPGSASAVFLPAARQLARAALRRA